MNCSALGLMFTLGMLRDWLIFHSFFCQQSRCWFECRFECGYQCDTNCEHVVKCGTIERPKIDGGVSFAYSPHMKTRNKS